MRVDFWNGTLALCPAPPRPAVCLGVTTRLDSVRFGSTWACAVRARPCITRRCAVCTTFHAFFSRFLLLLLMLLRLRSGLVR